ncbi:response regulator transcription factor [Paractinoplanes atraurantiacus]|uniref:DNA-binding response regulator, OmpR family, contains REC and winged-helix (WHTH) domain n=1 Tax=Paractinoplanes atraurantiacus TaxID=1036182 RepID=A0A285IHG8_9ACTN|nr:response regulator transcription factor [Actinoplanes atraurantiacus]SNY47425.1 DNA-binding response regulator, OmpR family, contains REC and winged-helix (wHTH) domain [Actinoplanes atraurantiacus]
MTARILIADDDPKHAQLIRLYLEREGHQVITVGDGRSALDVARARKPDLLVLDVMMPLVDGLDVCRILRAESDVAILLVTARSSENDMLLGLDIGADDYMAKPVSPRELTARVRALLRRAGSSEGGPLRVGDLEIDAGRYEVRVRGEEVTLTAKEFAILELLAKEPGRVFTRGQIIDKAFGFEHDVSERTVDAHVVNLRRKVEKNPAEPEYVQTVYGRGYRMAEH